MKTRKFKAHEILFSPTSKCNLRCAHCEIKKYPMNLSKKAAIKFLNECADTGIKRLGFTGGEPFLALDFLCAITKEAIRCKMLFSRIMTNGVWFRTKKELTSSSNRLFCAGYDGDICISVDIFHSQNLQKVAFFIKTVLKIWNRRDMISISAVKGSLNSQTQERLKNLAKILNARLTNNTHGYSLMKNKNLFIKIFYIDLSPIGKASLLKNPWNKKWFKDDFCKGPGNVFFVLPDGTVKPCCGYANDSDMLTIGSIKRDTPQKLLRNVEKNSFVFKIFRSGFHPIRRALEKSGIHFPGKTTNHCFFCYYLTSGRLAYAGLRPDKAF